MAFNSKFESCEEQLYILFSGQLVCTSCQGDERGKHRVGEKGYTSQVVQTHLFDRQEEVLGVEVVEIKFSSSKFTNYRTSDVVFNRILSRIGTPEEAEGSRAVLEPSSSDPTVPKKFPNSSKNTRGDQPF